MKRLVACTTLVTVAFVLVGCASDKSVPSAVQTRSPNSRDQAVLEPVRYPGILPRIAATKGAILASDNSFPAQFELHEVSGGASIGQPTSPIHLASSSINSWRDDFIIVGRECSTSEAEPNEELVCVPGYPVAQRYDPGADQWTTIARGKSLGSNLHGLNSFVKGDEVIIASPFENGDTRGYSVARVKIADGQVVAATESPLEEPTTAVTASNACLSGDSLVIFQTVSEHPTKGQVALHALSLSTGEWTTSTPSDVQAGQMEWIQNPACVRGGVVAFTRAADSVGTLAYLDNKWIAINSAPSGELSELVPIEDAAEVEVWVAGTLWRLDQKAMIWKNTGVHAEHLAAVATVDSGTARLTYESGFDSPVKFSLNQK